MAVMGRKKKTGKQPCQAELGGQTGSQHGHTDKGAGGKGNSTLASPWNKDNFAPLVSRL